MDLTRNKITTALNKLNLSENAYVTLKYKAGTQVFHYTGDYLDGAFNETNALYDVARVVAHEGIRKDNSLINNLRNNGALDSVGKTNSCTRIYDMRVGFTFNFDRLLYVSRCCNGAVA